MALQEDGHRTPSFLLTRSALAGYGLDMRVSPPSFESSWCRSLSSSIGTRPRNLEWQSAHGRY
jgi:hypothetical protein